MKIQLWKEKYMHKLLLKLCGNLAGKLCNSFTIAETKFLKPAASVLPTGFFFVWSKRLLSIIAKNSILVMSFFLLMHGCCSIFCFLFSLRALPHQFTYPVSHIVLFPIVSLNSQLHLQCSDLVHFTNRAFQFLTSFVFQFHFCEIATLT